jgi:hypothetical protein
VVPMGIVSGACSGAGAFVVCARTAGARVTNPAAANASVHFSVFMFLVRLCVFVSSFFYV